MGAFAGNRDEADFALGAEGVGVVAARGAEVTNVEVGDAVCFVNAAFAEYATSKASLCWKIPAAAPSTWACGSLAHLMRHAREDRKSETGRERARDGRGGRCGPLRRADREGG